MLQAIESADAHANTNTDACVDEHAERVDCASAVSATSVEIQTFVLLTFDTESDRVGFNNLLLGVTLLLWVFVGASAATFCTSSFTRAPSNVDVISMSVDILTVDVASAVMVLVGFTSTHAYVRSPRRLLGTC